MLSPKTYPPALLRPVMLCKAMLASKAKQAGSLIPKSGFTLIEILIAVALIGVIGTIVTQVFFLGFKSQAKSEMLKEIKQNGDYTITVIEGMVRNASDIIPVPTGKCNNNSDAFSIINSDGYMTTFIYSNNKIASISSKLPPPEITPTGVPLTGNRVSIASCIFRVVCPDPPVSPKYVFLSFTILPYGSSLTPTPGNITTLDYQTTVGLRNYK